MPSGVHLDIEAIHRDLWERSDRLHRIKVRQTDLAERWDVNKFTASRTMARLVDEDRIRQVSTRGQNNGLFVVRDPDQMGDS